VLKANPKSLFTHYSGEKKTRGKNPGMGKEEEGNWAAIKDDWERSHHLQQ